MHNLTANRAAVEGRRAAWVSATLRHTLRAWRSHAAVQLQRRVLAVQRCDAKQRREQLRTALTAWRSDAAAHKQAKAAAGQAADRLSYRMMRAALQGWRRAAQARRKWRTALMHFMQR